MTVLCERYEIEALLGRGGMGEVFRAWDRTLAEAVAVKVLRVEPSEIVAAALRFKQEVRLARRVTHKNVARVFDLALDGEQIFLTMELIDGETLDDLLLREGTLPLARAVGIAVDVCAGLSTVHAAGIVHRDLKPSNVLLEAETGRVVLTDFGVARSTRDAASVRLGMIVGTPRYMAPEQAEGLPVDLRADVYSLGVMLREMAGASRWGLRPQTPEEVGSRPVPEASSTGRYAALVARCTERERDARPGSVDEVVAELEAITRTASSKPPARTHRSLVVLPFRVSGSATDVSFGAVMADALTDVLCTVRELRVVASNAAGGFATSRESAAAHVALGVDALIDGLVQVDGNRMRVTVRFVEAPSGNQPWREEYDGTLSQLLSLESTIAKRIAEHLRVRLTAAALDDGVPAEAMRSYLRACALRMDPTAASEHLALLERAVSLHPTFAPALSALALRSLTAWYVPFVHTPEGWGRACAARVEQALAGAGSLAESHVAAAYLHTEHGAPREAELALRRALDLAPTCVEALVALGELECQTGRSASGTAHARLATTLDPGTIMPVVTLAREEAYAGKLDACVARLDALGDAAFNPPAYLLRIRAAGWHGSKDIVRAWMTRGTGMSDALGRFPYGEVLARALLGESSRDEQEGLFAGLVAIGKSPRFQAESLRIATEVSILGERRDDALVHLRALATVPAFFDVAWLERCPALAPLRDDPAWTAVHDAACRRAYAA